MNTNDSTSCILRKAASFRVLLPTLLILTLPAGMQAQDFTYTTNNGTVVIIGYGGPGGDVIIPDTIEGLPVTAIGGYVFMWTTEPVTSITIPDTVTSIGDYAFQYSHLTNAVIGNSVTNIGKLAFSYLPLASITIPDSVLTIGDSAFAGCASLTSVILPDSVIAIGEGAFAFCSGLLNITTSPFNPAYSSLGGVLFNKGTNTLTQCPGGRSGSYTVPDSVTTIGRSAFGGCTSLTSVTIPDSVTSIEWNGFRGCANLTNITLGNSLATIGASAFENCFSLSRVIIPDSVTNLGMYAFMSCTNLTNATIGNSVPEISFFAFFGCTSLTSVTIPASVTYIGGGSFYACLSLTSITVDPANPAYSSLDGIVFNKNQTSLISCPAGRSGSYTIPNSVTSIGGGAFTYCTGLTNIIIPNTVTSIGGEGLSYCTSLANITIPSSVTNIAAWAFRGCTNLTAVYFQGKAPMIGSDVFYSAVNATVFYLPSVTGWGPVFGNRPTALWLPQIKTGDASFGLRTNQFGFDISWAGGMTVVIEACTNLVSPVWIPVTTNTLNGNTQYFSDPDWTNYPTRLYRLQLDSAAGSGRGGGPGDPPVNPAIELATGAEGIP